MGYDEFGFEEHWGEPFEAPVPDEAPSSEPHVPMRSHFPPSGSNYMGGSSDGNLYQSTFAGSSLAHTYAMVRDFLKEEGYGDLPLPETAEELRLFKKSKCPQLQLFDERGYIHNPIKILFPQPVKQRYSLLLLIYNEQAEKHLLRFHGLLTS